MKTILLAIAHYGSKNREYFLRCLREYNSFKKYTIEVHLYTTEELNVDEFENLTIYQHVFHESIKDGLVLQHKQLFKDNRNKFDYYMYYEDDVLVTESNIDTYMEHQATLSIPYNCGFLRFEYKDGSDYKYLLDNHPEHSCHRWGKTVVKANYVFNGVEYLEVYNFHQGGYIFPKELMNFVLDFGYYFSDWNYYGGRALEGAASDVFLKCGVIKLIPRKQVSELLVHHLPNRYVNWQSQFYTEAATPNDKKLALMQPNTPWHE